MARSAAAAPLALEGRAAWLAPSGIDVPTRVFVFLVLVDIFFTFSRVAEVFPIAAGPVSLSMTIRVMTFLAAFFSGRILNKIGSPISVRMFLFSFWLVVIVPFSTWKSGSLNLLLHFWVPSLVGFLAVSALLESSMAVRQALYAVGFGSALIVGLSLVLGSLTQNRWQVDTGSLGNPNDLALMLLIGVPGILLFFYFNKGRRYGTRLLLVAAVILMLRTVANTGSRAALITLLIYGALLFFSASQMTRLKIAVIGLVAMVIFFATASRTALMRYATIIPFISLQSTDADESRMEESAEASTIARQNLLRASIELTLRNPIFGVGPGTFTSASADLSRQEKTRASWHESHNTYTQISSECGLPGLILYLSLMWACFRVALRVRKKTRGVRELGHLEQMAFCLLLMLSCFAINAIFSSMAYLSVLPFLAAITDAFERSASKNIASWESARKMAKPVQPGAAVLPLIPSLG
jgi:O-antigen ligase